jgi:hypothetical protein
MRGLGAIDLLEAGSERGALTSPVNVAGPFATRAQDRAGDMKTPRRRFPCRYRETASCAHVGDARPRVAAGRRLDA